MKERDLLLTKTDKVLRALIGICQNTQERITQERLWELLDYPSRAQMYKLVSEFLMEKSYRPAILIKYEDGENIKYGLNPSFYSLILKN